MWAVLASELVLAFLLLNYSDAERHVAAAVVMTAMVVMIAAALAVTWNWQGASLDDVLWKLQSAPD